MFSNNNQNDTSIINLDGNKEKVHHVYPGIPLHKSNRQEQPIDERQIEDNDVDENMESLGRVTEMNRVVEQSDNGDEESS